MILCTMLATICQTLVIGIVTLMSPVGSDAASEALTCGLVGVPLIITANAITMAIYGSDFSAGRACMLAHILLLVQTNFYLPLIWWSHQAWKNSSINARVQNGADSRKSSATFDDSELLLQTTTGKKEE